ncbi:hypothetical protein [Kiloniella sp.]|uniref:hypothetical protein n=1 Tax=Kiloniella sp. TaxID=1938587 RepID=UPI003B018DC7
MPGTSVNVAGTWKVATPWINVGGVWKPCTSVWVRDATAWKLAFESTLILSITTEVTDYNIKDAAIASGWNGTDDISIQLDISAAAIIGATSKTAALRTGGFGAPLKGLIINNAGSIQGQGGSGAGGTAFYAEDDCEITNSGNIWGAGGQGGTGEGGRVQQYSWSTGGGGGAGQGYNQANGGGGRQTASGGAGSCDRGQDDTDYYQSWSGGSGSGGTGGTWGNGGSSGSNNGYGGSNTGQCVSFQHYNNASGGSRGGYSINGVSRVNLTNTGSILGSQVN